MSDIPESAKPPDATAHRAVSGSTAAVEERPGSAARQASRVQHCVLEHRLASTHRAAATKAPAGRTAVLAVQATLDRLANATVRTAKAMLPAFLPVSRGLQPMRSQTELEQASGAVLRNRRRGEHRGEKCNALARTGGGGATTWCDGRQYVTVDESSICTLSRYSCYNNGHSCCSSGLLFSASLCNTAVRDAPLSCHVLFCCRHRASARG